MRQKTFREIWYSEEAQELRRRIHKRDCWCTNEIFRWSSINYQPSQLARAIEGAKVWEKPGPLKDGEKLAVVQQSASGLKILGNSAKTV